MLVIEQEPSRWQRAHYRVGQFLHGWRARLSEDDRRLVQQTLSPAALAIFDRMPQDAQVHSVRVLRSLQASGATPADLAVAALLHDVGKVAASDAGAYLGLWMRGPVVLLEAFAPALLLRLAAPQPAASLRYAIHVQLMHPQIGAAWARAAGCSELACWLIEHHQDKGGARGEGRGAPPLTHGQISQHHEAAGGARGEGRGASHLAASSDSATVGKARDDAPRPSPLAPHLLSRLQWADGRN